MSGLTLDLAVPERDVAVRLQIAAGEVLALLGPNGAGKSTVLEVIAGLIPDGGSVCLAGRELAGRPPSRRPVGLLSQQPLLFPHLSATANVAFPLRCRRVGRAQSRRRAGELLGAVGVGDLGGRKPAQLSGGQAQRVAIARALAAEPEVLLLDEPLAALDAAAAPAIRALLREVLRRRRHIAIVVSHDVADVVALADRVAVLEQGRVVEQGALADVVGGPRNDFVGRMTGTFGADIGIPPADPA
ncbi:ABC transporter ATP-binding protein [Skermania piniformis]|uniref:ABC transporter ATP-binding protein n=1 Tax=Skermania pinensis TaxID=39122 RepID=UPI000832E23A|nr:ATP-binding cassette domain-containing protein [Skermania piniformis]